MGEEHLEKDGPPKPPQIDRRVRLRAVQLIGFPIMALIPLLAIADIFDERWATADVGGAQFRATVEYPTRFRARISRPMVIRVENRSADTLGTVDVALDPAYVERFAAAAFTPPAREAYIVSFASVGPGEARRVHLELEGERPGDHAGRVVVRTRADSAAVRVHTTVFP